VNTVKDLLTKKWFWIAVTPLLLAVASLAFFQEYCRWERKFGVAAGNQIKNRSASVLLNAAAVNDAR